MASIQPIRPPATDDYWGVCWFDRRWSQSPQDKGRFRTFKEGDSEDIVEKITKLLADKELSKKMGMEGAKFVRDEFNWKKVTENFLDIIKPYLKN